MACNAVDGTSDNAITSGRWRNDVASCQRVRQTGDTFRVGSASRTRSGIEQAVFGCVEGRAVSRLVGVNANVSVTVGVTVLV